MRKKITALSREELEAWEKDSSSPSAQELARFSLLLLRSFKKPGPDVLGDPKRFLQEQRAALARKGFSKRALVHGYYTAQETQRWLPSTALLVQLCEDAGGEEDWLLDAICEELHQWRLPVPHPRSALKALAQYKTYWRDSRLVREWLERNGNVQAVQRANLARVAVRCYFRYIDRRSGSWSEAAPLSIHSALAFIDYLPDAVEAGFPGYARNGLLGALATTVPVDG
jgi:hypothetical protein